MLRAIISSASWQLWRGKSSDMQERKNEDSQREIENSFEVSKLISIRSAIWLSDGYLLCTRQRWTKVRDKFGSGGILFAMINIVCAACKIETAPASLGGISWNVVRSGIKKFESKFVSTVAFSILWSFWPCSKYTNFSAVWIMKFRNFAESGICSICCKVNFIDSNTSGSFMRCSIIASFSLEKTLENHEIIYEGGCHK